MATKKSKKKVTKVAKTATKATVKEDKVTDVIPVTVKKEVKIDNAGTYQCMGGRQTIRRDGKDESFAKDDLIEVSVKEYEQHLLPFLTKWKKV